MNLEYHELFREDILEAAQFLEERVEGLGAEFIDEVEATIERIKQHPKAWRKITQGIRRIQLQRFKYIIRYQIFEDQNTIYILSLTHCARHPDYGLTDRI